MESDEQVMPLGYLDIPDGQEEQEEDLQVDPEGSRRQTEHAQEILHKIEKIPRIFPGEYPFTEALAWDESSSQEDIRKLAELMEGYPGVVFKAWPTINQTINNRVKQTELIRERAQINGVNLDGIYENQRVKVGEILSKLPEKLNPYDPSKKPELKESVMLATAVEPDEDAETVYNDWMDKIIPNIVYAGRLKEVADIRFLANLPAETNTTS